MGSSGPRRHRGFSWERIVLVPGMVVGIQAIREGMCSPICSCPQGSYRTFSRCCWALLASQAGFCWMQGRMNPPELPSVSRLRVKRRHMCVSSFVSWGLIRCLLPLSCLLTSSPFLHHSEFSSAYTSWCFWSSWLCSAGGAGGSVSIFASFLFFSFFQFLSCCPTYWQAR